MYIEYKPFGRASQCDFFSEETKAQSWGAKSPKLQSPDGRDRLDSVQGLVFFYLPSKRATDV